MSAAQQGGGEVPQDERAAFEAHMRAVGADDFTLRRAGDEYKNPIMEDHWSIWQARAQQDTGRDAALVSDDLRVICDGLALFESDTSSLQDHARCERLQEYFGNYSAATQAAPEVASVPALSADDVQWITNDNAELGVKIGNQFFFLYKGHSLVYEDGTHDDGRPMMYRPVFKREFGECVHPLNHNDYSKIGTVSLSDSDKWKEISVAARANKEA